MACGKCATRSATKTQFVKKSTIGNDLASSLSAVTSNTKLSWNAGEMHLLGIISLVQDQV